MLINQFNAFVYHFCLYNSLFKSANQEIMHKLGFISRIKFFLVHYIHMMFSYQMCIILIKYLGIIYFVVNTYLNAICFTLRKRKIYSNINFLRIIKNIFFNLKLIIAWCRIRRKLQIRNTMYIIITSLLIYKGVEWHE